ncbi:uncharacterized protein LOC143039178 isoform X2 [Oratosquilla oratoria]|uniref:uncharacterized protein LOC143039178 isoform X2 n=1 Tax=Oratosquilla oratoria TaxID=337810 RepID=UPI003F766070
MEGIDAGRVAFKYPVMMHTGLLDCDNEIFCVSSPQPRVGSMFPPAPTVIPPPLPTKENYLPSTSEVQAGTCKRKRVSNPKISSVLYDTLSILKL